MGIAGREVISQGESILVRARHCEIQRAIAKAGIADCGIATATTYRGLARGLFGKETELKVEHLKNMNQGADCCEVRVWNPTGVSARHL